MAIIIIVIPSWWLTVIMSNSLCAVVTISICVQYYTASHSIQERVRNVLAIKNVWLVTGYDHDVQIKVKIGAHSLAT